MFRWRMFEASRVPIVVMDADSRRFVDCNPAAIEIYRFTKREEILGQTPMAVSAPTQYDGTLSSEKASHYIAEALAQGNVVFEWRHQRPDGELWDAEVHLMRFETGQGQFLQFTLQEITRRKRMEEELADSRANFEALIESTSDLIWSVDAEYRLIIYNQALAEHLKRNRNLEIKRGMALHHLFTDALRQRWLAYYDRAREAGDFRVDYALPDGRMLLLSFNPIRGAGGFSGVSVFGKDVTQSKRAEAQLRESEARLRAITDSAHDAIIMMDPSGAISFWNSAAQQILGYQASEAMGRNLHELLAPERYRAAYEAGFSAFLKSGQGGAVGKTVEMAARHQDGREIAIDLSLSAVVIDNEWHSVGILRDITGRKQAEATLRDYQRQLAEIIQFLPDATLAIDRDKRVIVWNKAIEEMTGIPAAAMIGQGDYAYTIPFYGERRPQLMDLIFEDSAEIAARYPQVTRQGKTLIGEFFCKALYANQGAWIFAKVAPLYDAAGKIAGAIESLRDITKSKQVAEHLRATEERLRMALEATEAGVWEVDLRTGHITIDTGALADLGYAPEEIPTTTEGWDSLTHPEDRERVASAYQALASGASEKYLVEQRTRRKDGTWSWSASQGRVVERTPEGLPVRLIGTYLNIDERKRVELALRETQRQLLTLMGNLPGMVYRCANQPDWPTIFSSDGCAALTGYSAIQLMQQQPAYGELIVPEQREPIWRRVQEAVASHRTFELNYQIITRNQELRWVWERGQGIYGDQGQLLYLEGFISDITERKTFEQRLETNERRLSMAISATADAIWEWNMQTGQTYYSPRWYEMLGYADQEFPMIHQTWKQLCHPADAQPADDRIQAILTTPDGGQFETEFRMRHKDGRWIWILGRGKVMERDASGQPLLLSGTNTDITQRKQTEEALRLRNLLLSSQQEASLDGILVVDENAQILSHNQRFVEMWQLPIELACGLQDEPVLQFIAAQMPDPGAFLQRVRSLYSHQEEIGRDELTLIDGRIIDRYSAPVRSPEGGYYGRAWYFRDITDRKNLEIQLRQAQKLEAVGQLAGGVAHDFNNILAALMMHLGLLQENPALDQEIRQSLKKMDGEARRAAALTRQLLMFSRRSVLDVKPLDLNAVVENLLKMLRRLIGEQIDLRFDVKTSLPGIEADAGMLEQVVMNLVVNARDAMPKGGRITLRTSVADLSEIEAAQAPERRPGRFVCLTVSDTGTGMDEATRKRIFEPFFTTKDPGKGTGLGLATVHGIVAQHKGWVEVASELGQGTTFTIFFAAMAQQVMEVAPAHATKPASRGSETILLVEDDASARQTIGQALILLGYRVYEAANGREAMTAWQAHGTQVELLLTDMVMPEGMTGLELAERLRAMRSGLKVIISSGYSAEIVQVGVLRKKGIVYLPKPYAIKTLAEAVRNCLDSSP